MFGPPIHPLWAQSPGPHRPRTSRVPHTEESVVGSRRSDSPSRRSPRPATRARRPRRAAGRGHALHVRVADQEGAFTMVVVHVALGGPVSGMGDCSLETVHDAGNAGQHQSDLSVQTALRLIWHRHVGSNSGCDPHRELFSIICMAGGDPDTENLAFDPAELLPLAVSRPHHALLAARAVLAAQPSAYDASLAHHAIGIVLRDHGNLAGAILELRKGLKLARASSKPEREADVQATLGVTLAWTGRSRQGLAVLDQAVGASSGGLVGRVLMRRALVLYEIGRFREAHECLRRALPYFRRARATISEARSLTWRAHVYLAVRLPRH